MWKSSFCLALAWLIAVFGVSWNVLLIQKGNSNGLTSAKGTVYFKWDSAKLVVKSDNDKETKKVSYSDAYNDCKDYNQEDTVYCDDLQDVENAGKIYVGFMVIGVCALTLAFVFCILILLGRICCYPSCECCWVISFIVLLAFLAFVIACGVMIAYVENLEHISKTLLALYAPKWYASLKWKDPEITTSIYCLIVSVVVTLIAMVMLIFVDGRNEKYSNSKAYYGRSGPAKPLHSQA